MIASPAEPLRVLVVDDDQEDFLITRRLLADAAGPAMRLDWADNLTSGLEAVQRGGHDVCLVDYELGGDSGLELVREAQQQGLRIPMILLTGHGSRTLDLEAQAAGAADFLAKGHLTADLLERTVRYSLERHRALIRLRESEERFRELAENVPVVFFVTDPDGEQVLYVSPAYDAVFDQPREALAERSLAWLDRVHPGDLARLRRQLQANGEEDLEFRIVRRDGEVRWIRRRVQLVRGPDGTALRRLGTVEDVTALHRAQEQVETRGRMEAIGRLAGGVAHDFNNLLTAILGEAELLRGELGEGHPGQPGVDEIIRSSLRAADLTRDLLAFSRQQVFNLGVLDLNLLVARMEKLLRRLIGEHITLVTTPAPGPALVLADGGQMEQVLMNLAVNARDAMSGGGTLSIRVAPVAFEGPAIDNPAGMAPGAYVALTVSDEGCGMTDEVKARIFEPFFTTKAHGQGTGLGLATVYGIVEQTGGSIVVESEPGGGARFQVLLPQYDGPANPDPLLPVVRPSARGTGTILLVEDEEALRGLVARVLEHHGYTVLAARDGGEALAISHAHRGEFDLVLTDIVMPGMTGLHVVEALRADRRVPAALYMSGYTERAVGDEGRRAIGGAFLAKPFTTSELLERVREQLEQAQG